jgi:hypothetical protein
LVCSSLLLFLLLGKKYGWSKIDWLLILTAGLGIRHFLVSCIEALYGQEGMKTAILVDQPGTFVLSTGNYRGYYVLKERTGGQSGFVEKIIFFRLFTFVDLLYVIY